VPATDLIGDLAVWRAAQAIPDSDHRPTVPAQPAKAPPRMMVRMPTAWN
jgi:hypothetical protein